MFDSKTDHVRACGHACVCVCVFDIDITVTLDRPDPLFESFNTGDNSQPRNTK